MNRHSNWTRLLCLPYAWLLCVTSQPALLNAQEQANPVVRIGSKSFTESVVLGECLAHLAREAGATVEHKAELGGTPVLWSALLNGDIDAYVEYTGTIRQVLLKDEIDAGESIRSESDMRAALAKKGADMSERLGFNNTYAIGMREDKAKSLGIEKLSDLRDHPDLRYGISHEFMERQDGWRPLEAKYRFSPKNIRSMDHSLAYRGLESNAIDATDLFTTDPEIELYHLRVLEDDKGFFPTYYAIILTRANLKERAPKVYESIMRLQERVDQQSMVGMASRVALDRELEADAAAEYLNKTLGSKIPLVSDNSWSRWQYFLIKFSRKTWQHMFLVVISLAFSIVAAVPLGIAAARNKNVGRIVLQGVGIIQTLPSMALLVFMIPLFGMGARPAIIALFLYSLLPIVRNTYAGIKQIPHAMIESAEVLGLSSAARLKLVELPLALPSILAGIKTAAVINVGTATMGALVGAGGYGETILTGIRLLNVPLILQGAVPAAVLAVLVQFLFTRIEKHFVSAGLRR